MFEGFSETWNFGNQADKFKCLSDFYNLLSYISRIDHSSREDAGNFKLIEPALEYMREHIYDSSLKIESLHRLCGISDTYFRKIFISRFDMTPQKYVTKERLARARLIIESGDYDTVSSVSESVGYIDPLYFSKAFRKQYGFPPTCICE
jgi:two-component system response regulator YesN